MINLILKYNFEIILLMTDDLYVNTADVVFYCFGCWNSLKFAKEMSRKIIEYKRKGTCSLLVFLHHDYESELHPETGEYQMIKLNFYYKAKLLISQKSTAYVLFLILYCIVLNFPSPDRFNQEK